MTAETWTVQSYRLTRSNPPVVANVSWYPDRPEPWTAQCAGPGESQFTATFTTADEAKSAVENHISDAIAQREAKR